MVTTAVILAAGLGSRLKERTREIPKGLVEVMGQSMVERSLAKLRKAGIERVVIGTGYLSHFYEDLAKNTPGIETGHNPLFAQTGSMYTLYALRHLLQEDFILLESDLLYEQFALTALLQDPLPDGVLASGATQSGDEVFMDWDAQGHLINMSKLPDELGKVEGELVGISKISLGLYQKMCAFMEAHLETQPGLHYEEAMVGLSIQHPIPVKKLEDLAWCEIDDEAHMRRALEQVIPKIDQQEKIR